MYATRLAAPRPASWIAHHGERGSATAHPDERTATWPELLFDLAFVLVVAELAVGLGDDRTLHGVLVFAGLFSSVW